MLILPYYNPIPTLVYQNFVGQPLPARLAASSVSAKYLHLNDAVYFYVRIILFVYIVFAFQAEVTPQTSH